MPWTEQLAWCLVAYFAMFTLMACVGYTSGPRDPVQNSWGVPWVMLLYPLVVFVLSYYLVRDTIKLVVKHATH